MTQNDYALHTLPVNIADEMKQSYMDYAMSVIIGRALPDVRDGMKPANRRVLYTMHELGLVPGKPFRKSAGIVGDVMGKYHPHGDARSTTPWSAWRSPSTCAPSWSTARETSVPWTAIAPRPCGTPRLG